MANITKEDVLDRLRSVTAPNGGDIVSAGIVSDIFVTGGKVMFSITVPADQANGIIAAGRADLCAIARPHLADPAWTLHEAARLQSHDVAWPRQYLSGRDQLYRELEKQKVLLAQAGLAQTAINSEAEGA